LLNMFDQDATGLLTRDEDIDRASRSMKAIAHPLRLKILCTLGNQEISVQDIVERVGTSQSNISQGQGYSHRPQGCQPRLLQGGGLPDPASHQYDARGLLSLHEVACGAGLEPGVRRHHTSSVGRRSARGHPLACLPLGCRLSRRMRRPPGVAGGGGAPAQRSGMVQGGPANAVRNTSPDHKPR
jgi:hypothetical protein